jgi:HEAT repeat protein
VIDSREQSVKIAGLSAPPTMVVFDDGNAVVKTLDFQQPTAWLGAQLARQGALWSSAWAIEQLRTRRADSAAAPALARAARDADHPAVRALATAALGDFPPQAALPALEAAARDTSALVRKAAVTSLRAVGGDRALSLVREIWTKDPSYEVRAAALTALSRLDPTGARGEILKGLETSSYRDVIQSAAIVAALQRPDTGVVRAIARRAGDQPLPAIALAVLSARGDSVAIRALAAALDDDRGWVRGWALDGVEQQLDRDDALAVLRAALPGVRKADARAAIEELVGRLEQEKS